PMSLRQTEHILDPRAQFGYVIADTPHTVGSEEGKTFPQLRRIDTRRDSEFLTRYDGYTLVGQPGENPEIGSETSHRGLRNVPLKSLAGDATGRLVLLCHVVGSSCRA